MTNTSPSIKNEKLGKPYEHFKSLSAVFGTVSFLFSAISGGIQIADEIIDKKKKKKNS